MKGLTHFMSGVALASFFPAAVKAAASTRIGLPEAQASFMLALGGLYGIMPDTLDFKFGQFFSRAEVQVDCDPNTPDPVKMARQIGEAIEEAAKTGKYMRAQLYPMQLASHLWRQYLVKFDAEANEIVVVINEIVATNQIPFMGTEPEENRVGRYKLKNGQLKDAHGKPSVVDIMSGPQFGFRKEEDDVISVEFLPWHRTWSHSYVLGLILALPWSILALAMGWAHPWLYSIIAFLGFAIHITEDLTGHMGGSLIWPFKNKRYDGLSWFRASNPHANFSVDWAATVIVIHNLWRFTTPEGADGGPLAAMPWYLYYFYFLVIPLTVYFTMAYTCKEPSGPKGGEISAAKAIEADAVEAAAIISPFVIDAKEKDGMTEADIRRQEMEFEAEDFSA